MGHLSLWVIWLGITLVPTSAYTNQAFLLEPDRKALEAFFDAILRHAGNEGYISSRSFYEDEADASAGIQAISLKGNSDFILDAIEDYCRRAAQHPRPIVYCPPLAVFNNPKHAREKDLLKGLALSVECDEHPQQARETLEKLLGPATVVVRSGGKWINDKNELEDKLHLHWRLKEPANRLKQSANGESSLDKLKQARRLATKLVGGDASNDPVCHPIRWPGSWHRKAQPRLCEIERCDPSIEIDLDAALEKLREAVPGPANATGNPANDPDLGSWEKLVGDIVTGASYHKPLTSLSARLKGGGLYDGQTVNLLRALMSSSTGPHDTRWLARYNSIPRLVKSAHQKFDVTGPLFDPWQRQAVLPVFPLEVLPAAIQKFVTSNSTVIGACPSALAMSALAGLSGALDHNFAVKMMRHGDWWADVRLWILLFGLPSAKKSPIIRAAIRPLVHLERHLRERFQAELEIYNRAKEEGDESAVRPAPEKPKRYTVIDTTTEKLGEILASDGGKGVLLKAEELSGWLANMERYTTSRGDRPFYLQAYDGGPFTVDRITRGELYIPNLSISILGGIQPDKLTEIRDTLTSDGLLQRFIPVIVQGPSLPQDVANDNEAYTELVQNLTFLAPQKFLLTDDALEVMTELRDHLYKLEQAGEGVVPGFSSFVGKLVGVCGSFALILHLAHNPKPSITRHIGRETIEDVRRLVLDFVVPHAWEFYYSSATRASERLQQIAAWILASGKDRIRVSDITAAIRSCRGITLKEINERLSPFVAGGWLFPHDNTPVCRTWTVNPEVHTQFAQQAAIIRENRKKIAELLKCKSA